jgi:hypothetical protein
MTLLRVISLGGGVQSTTMALMAVHGEVGPMPDCAVFADTGWEPQAVYRHLDWLIPRLPFKTHIVRRGNIRADTLARENKRFITVPFYLKGPNGQEGMGGRQCTSHYKIEPMLRLTRRLLGKGPSDRIPAGAVEKWVGISVDEVYRATLSKTRYEVKRFPLLEQRMTRSDCLAWLARHGYPTPPKSACIGCPYHSNSFWRDLKANSPVEWAEAVAVDKAIRRPVDRPGTPQFSEQFIHRSRRTLDEVDLSTSADAGQLNLFINEGAGMCGV